MSHEVVVTQKLHEGDGGWGVDLPLITIEQYSFPSQLSVFAFKPSILKYFRMQ